jgi:hypothetical protein
MSIRSLADTRGVQIVIQTATKTVDSVGCDVYAYSGFVTKNAYVSGGGAAWEQDNDRPASPRRVTVYIPGNDDISGQDRISIDHGSGSGTIYQVMNVKHPGLRTTGALAYTIVECISDPGFTIHS